MNPRKATVMNCGIAPGAVELRFRGSWLKAWGFHQGASIQARHISAGKLELTVNGPAQLTSEDFTEARDHLSIAIASFDRQFPKAT